MRTHESGNPFRHLWPTYRLLVAEYEERGDFLGALQYLREDAELKSEIGRAQGEEKPMKGTLRNAANAQRNAVSFAERSHFQEIERDLYSVTGVRVPWRLIRERGVSEALDYVRKGEPDEEYWT